MKILNPDYFAPADGNQAPHVKNKAAVLNALADMAGKPGMSFDEVRAALGKDEKALPDGAIHQIALDAGFKVEP